MNQKRSRNWIRITFVLLGVAFFLFAWWMLSIYMKSIGNSVLLSPFESISRAATLLFGNSVNQTWKAIGWTLLRLVIGFGASMILATILGTLAGLYPWLESFLKPWVAFSRTVPTVAVVILLSTLLVAPKTMQVVNYIPCMLTFLVAFPLLYQAFVSGIQSEDQAIIHSLDLENGHKSLKSIVSVLWPDAWPYIKLSLAQGIGLSLKVSIMSEVLSANSASKPGIGSLIVYCQTDPMGRLEDIIPYSLIALLIMAILDIPLIVLKLSKKNS